MKVIHLLPLLSLCIGYWVIPSQSQTVKINDLTLVEEKTTDDLKLKLASVTHHSNGNVVHTFNNVAHTSDGSVVHTFNNVGHTSDGSVVHVFSNVGHTSNGGVVHSPFGFALFDHGERKLPTPNIAIGTIPRRG